MTTYRITNLENPIECRDYPDIIAGFRPASLLPVPYISQLESGALLHHNDCGAASGLMLLKAYKPDSVVSVDEFYDRCNPGPDEYLSVGQIRSTLASYGLLTNWQVGLSLGSLLDNLITGKPLLVLVNYGVLVRAGLTEKKNFRGAHFFVAVGLDNKYIYTHDPYCTKKNGEACLFPVDVFLESWRRCDEQSNPYNAALIPNSSLYAPKGPVAPVLYRVKVKADTNTLNIRSGPSANFLDIGDLHKGDQVDIFIEQNGWGEIGSNRWICLKYTDRI